ncbi:TonB-like protein [Tahibacter aquaticus]|uniref:TonB-like protein n=1 Tax=Tahibacter aquaticus TaxID=520092 RepID=A0A4R6YRE2_9GAMM|nr:hypothetical protein [Tahibacter aquaticus]TDR40414.1 TonB-like protein [Tahibacter aquaticus]
MPLFLPLLLSATLPLSATAPIEFRDREKIADLWTLANAEDNPPFYPAENLQAGKMGCVAVGFQIEADGSTSDVQVLRVVVNGAEEEQARGFGDATKIWAGKLRYAPVGRPRPVYTYDITTFTLAPTKDRYAADALPDENGLTTFAPNSTEGSAKTTEERGESLMQRCVIEDFPATMRKLSDP